jgi:hypothetical protein
MSNTWKAAIGVILIFILGWFGGALTTLVITHHRMLLMIQHDPAPLAKLLERQTTRNLDIDDQQRAKLHTIFLENLKARAALQKQIQPEVKEANKLTLQQINAVLTPVQEQRFQENLVRFKERFGRNPFNVGSENDAPAPASPPPADLGSATNAPAASK